MPWLPMYLDAADVTLLTDWLSDEQEIAFLLPTGAAHGWKAAQRVRGLVDGRYVLWHIPGGPLPVFRPPSTIGQRPTEIIADPWTGWTEISPGADALVPYFGSCPATLHLNIRVRDAWPGARADSIGLSSFEWIGNHYKIIGHSAKPATERWWQKLKRFAKKHAIRVPRGGPLDGPYPEVWTFPAARQAYERGRALAMNA